MSRRRARVLVLIPAAVAVALGACVPTSDGGAGEAAAPPAASAPVAQALDPPAAPGALAPHLAVDAERLVLSWLEPADSPAAGSGHRLRYVELEGDSWSPVRTVVEGSDFFANWADVPSVVPLGGDAWIAHWLAKIGGETYAYSIRLAGSTDGGQSWQDLGFLPRDDSPTEHGFAALVADGGEVRAFWLDGRQMADGGPMALRTARLSSATHQRSAETVLDDRVCECCPLDAAWTADGPVVVYRDRSDEEIRNIRLVRRVGDAWSEPVTVHDDGWEIAGCPVNGPSVAVDGERLAVAWFTAANDRPTVRLAFSADGGATFAAPIDVDTATPLGRVDLLLDGGEAVVSWLAAAGEDASLRVQRFTADGPRGPSLSVARTSSSRRSGFPRMAKLGDDLYLAWVDVPDEGLQRLRSVRLAAPR